MMSGGTLMLLFFSHIIMLYFQFNNRAAVRSNEVS